MEGVTRIGGPNKPIWAPGGIVGLDPVEGPSYFVNNVTGNDSNTGYTQQVPLKKLSTAMGKVNTYHSVTSHAVKRCRIWVFGTTIPYGTPQNDTLTLTLSYCDIVGVGCNPLGNGGGASGNGGGVPCISGYPGSTSIAAHGWAPATTCRGVNIYNMLIVGGAAKNGLHLAAGVAFYRGAIKGCAFQDAGAGALPNAGIYIAGNFAQNLVENCEWGSQATYMTYGIQVVGAITFNTNRFNHVNPFGSTAGILIPNGVNGENTVFENCRVMHPASAMVNGISCADATGNIVFDNCRARGSTKGIDVAVAAALIGCTSIDNVTGHHLITATD